MPKLTELSVTQKISIHDIIRTGNIRADYTGIEELAASIKKNSLLEPILVKPQNEEGKYELVAGERRLTAHEWLYKNGDDFSRIEAKVVTGDKLIIQIVENLQRVDLSASDREKAIFQMSEMPGVTQKQIALELSKETDYISKQIAAYKVRKIADAAGCDTSQIGSTALYVISGADEKDIPMLIGYINEGGGTKSAAEKIMKQYRPPKKGQQEPPKAEPEKVETQGKTEQGDTAADAKASQVSPEKAAAVQKTETLVTEKPKRSEEIRRENPDAYKRKEIEHKIVDLNDVLCAISDFGDAIKIKIDTFSEKNQMEAKDESIKYNTVLDIIALLHEKFDTQAKD